nr:outer membrane beta-barrel protein [uncultured Flavobacterium sp.]
MKTKLLLLFIVIFSLKSYCQTSTDSNTDWKIGFKFSFDNNISSEKINYSQYIGYLLKFDKFNYTTGITVEKKLSNRFSMNSGLEYSNKDFTGTYYCAVCEFSWLPSPQTFELRFVQIPIVLKYEYQINSLSLFASSGINNSFTVKNQLDENDYLLIGNFGMGMGYQINNNFIFELSSEYNKSLTKLYDNTSYNQKSIGITIAIKKGF